MKNRCIWGEIFEINECRHQGDKARWFQISDLASAEKSVKKWTQFFSECKTGMRSSKFFFYGMRRLNHRATAARNGTRFQVCKSRLCPHHVVNGNRFRKSIFGKFSPPCSVVSSRLPSCSPGFQSQTYHLWVFQFIMMNLDVYLMLEWEKDENITKRGFNKISTCLQISPQNSKSYWRCYFFCFFKL